MSETTAYPPCFDVREARDQYLRQLEGVKQFISPTAYRKGMAAINQWASSNGHRQMGTEK